MVDSVDVPSPMATKLGLAALVLGGILLATLPHLISWWTTGDPAYFADGDELLYLAWSRGVVLDGEVRIADAIHAESGPMMHPWLLFVPPGWIGHMFGVGTTGLGIVWRVLAGLGLALGLYLALRPILTGALVALGTAAWLLFDPGLAFGQVAFREAEIIVSLLRGSHEFFDHTPWVMAHLRVVTPGLAIPVLLIHLGAMVRARREPGRRPMVVASLSFGLLFYMYFYFWTTVGLGLVLACVADRRGLRRFATVLTLGTLVGLPSVIEGYLTKSNTSPDWLLRTDKFLPIGRFEELEISRTFLVVWAVAGLWVFARRRDLTYLWCAAGAGFVLRIHQVMSGLQIENSHWSYAQGIPLSLLLAGLIVPALPAWRPIRNVMFALLAAHLALGVFLRAREATRTTETLEVAASYDDIRDILPHLPIGSVVAGDPEALAIASALVKVRPLSGRLVEYSALADNTELDERLVLNLFLLGLSRDEAVSRVHGPPGVLSREGDALRSPEVARRQRERRLGLIEAVWCDPSTLLKAYGVTHLVLPRGAPAAHMTGRGRRMIEGMRWGLWALGPPRREDQLEMHSDQGGCLRGDG